MKTHPPCAGNAEGHAGGVRCSATAHRRRLHYGQCVIEKSPRREQNRFRRANHPAPVDGLREITVDEHGKESIGPARVHEHRTAFGDDVLDRQMDLVGVAGDSADCTERRMDHHDLSHGEA